MRKKILENGFRTDKESGSTRNSKEPNPGRGGSWSKQGSILEPTNEMQRQFLKTFLQHLTHEVLIPRAETQTLTTELKFKGRNKIGEGNC